MLLSIPNFKPGYSAGAQIVNTQNGGPSGGNAGWPKILLQNVPRTFPNGNLNSMNGPGGYVSGFYGFHWAGPATPAQPGVMPYGNQYAYANQNLLIPGMAKNPAAAS